MYSNRVVYDETLVPKKSTNGRHVRFPCTSGDVDSSTTAQVQVLQWNNIQSTARKNIMKNFRFNGKLKVHMKIAEADKDVVLKLNADLNRFIDINCTVNGTCNYLAHGNAIEPIYKNYIDGEISYMDNQTYYNLVSTKLAGVEQTTGWKVSSGTADAKNIDYEIDFSVKLMHPFLYTELGGVSALNITITTNPGLLGLLDIESNATVDTTVASPTYGQYTKITEINAVIDKASITYVEYEGASETFIKKIGYMTQYQSKCAGGVATAQTRNVIGAPLNVYSHIGIEGPVLSTYNTLANMQKPIPMNTFNATVNNNVNCYNIIGIQEIFGRSKEMGYIGQMSDFTSSPNYLDTSYNKASCNEYGCVIKLSDRNLDVNINTGEVYRFDATVAYNNTVRTKQYLDNYLYLYTVYEYPAIIYLSPEKSVYEYIVNEPVEELGDYVDEDLYAGAGLFDWIRKGFNWLRGNKILSKGASALSGILPGTAGTVASVVGDVAGKLGMSTSVF